MVAAAMTALMPGAGPPPTRMASVFMKDPLRLSYARDQPAAKPFAAGDHAGPGERGARPPPDSAHERKVGVQQRQDRVAALRRETEDGPIDTGGPQRIERGPLRLGEED